MQFINTLLYIYIYIFEQYYDGILLHKCWKGGGDITANKCINYIYMYLITSTCSSIATCQNI